MRGGRKRGKGGQPRKTANMQETLSGVREAQKPLFGHGSFFGVFCHIFVGVVTT